MIGPHVHMGPIKSHGPKNEVKPRQKTMGKIILSGNMIGYFNQVLKVILREAIVSKIKDFL